ncbi:MAG TPA: arginine--tRNA ligase [Candidatus Paceibacterota bacterium]
MIKELFRIIKKEIGEETEFDVQVSENPQFGHYATNAALRLAGVLKRPPIEVARDLAERIKKKDAKEFFEKIEAVPPGFINFWLSTDTFQKELSEILKKKERYGRLSAAREKAQVEFVSSNPTGPLTLANGRGGFFGDALAAVLEAAGFKVEREYYVNDTGKQILTLGKSLLAARGFLPDEESFYKGDYVKSWAEEHADLVKKFHGAPMKLGGRAAKDFLASIKAALSKKARIRFDRWTSEEKDIRAKGYDKKVMSLFRKRGFAYDKDGAVWLKTTDFGDDKDRVLVTSDKFSTYFLSDAGHYLETKKRGFGFKINILGPDHHGYVSRIQAVARIVGLKHSEVIITQAVRLLRNGIEVKMSKRKGDFVTFESLVGEVGLDPARFFFLMYAPETHMDFDLELAKERSMKNPVYYAQYAYVRMGSILAKFKGARGKKADLTFLKSEAEANLMRELVKLPDIVAATAKDYRLNRLPRYAVQIARTFHNFYERERVLDKDPNLSAARIALVKAARYILGSVFDLLGITKLDKM